LKVKKDPAGTGPQDMGVKDLTAAHHEEKELEDRYGSLRGLLENAPDASLLGDCITHCNLPESRAVAHPKPPGLPRTAQVLYTLHDMICNGSGLEEWFTTCLDSAHDTMAAIRMTGAAEMDRFLCTFVARAMQHGCDALNAESWRAYFHRDPRHADEGEALRLAPTMITQFRAWALASPEAIAAVEAAQHREHEEHASMANGLFFENPRSMTPGTKTERIASPADAGAMRQRLEHSPPL
jgi:hypothetical protein